MNVQFLDCDELAVECLVRNIVGTVSTKISKLKEVLEKEISKEIDPPIRAHPNALKSPKREILICSNKLKNIENQVNIITDNYEFDAEKIQELTTGVLHVGDRLGRISSSKSVSVVSAKLISVCQKLLNCFGDICVKKTVSTDMENSLKQVFEEIVDDDENENHDSSDESVEFNKVINHPNRSSQQLEQSQIMVDPNLIPELTEDERMDLVVDRIIRKLSLTGIPPPNNQRSLSSTNYFEPQPQEIPHNNNVQLPTNFNPHFPPPSYGLNVNQPNTSTTPGFNLKMPKLYLEIYNWKMVYHGDEKDELPVERFLYRVQRMALENGLAKDRLVANFSVLLRDKALNWYWEYQETYGTVNWETLSEAMVQRFKTRRTDDDVKQTLERRKQRVKEPFLDYYHAIRSMTLSLIKPLADIDLIHLLNRNMRGGLQAQFAGHQFMTISEMVSQCVRVEDTWTRIGWTPEIYHQGRPRQVNEFEVIANSDINETFNYHCSEQPQHFNSVCAVTSNNFNPSYAKKQQKATFDQQLSPNACWNCFGIGHFFKDCIIPIKHRFCFGCGIPNTLKSQCLRCKYNQKGNAMRDFSNAGMPNSRTQTNLPPRTTREEAATNTDPELYQAILKR